MRKSLGLLSLSLSLSLFPSLSISLPLSLSISLPLSLSLSLPLYISPFFPSFPSIIHFSTDTSSKLISSGSTPPVAFQLVLFFPSPSLRDPLRKALLKLKKEDEPFEPLTAIAAACPSNQGTPLVSVDLSASLLLLAVSLTGSLTLVGSSAAAFLSRFLRWVWRWESVCQGFSSIHCSLLFSHMLPGVLPEIDRFSRDGGENSKV